jgi:hypothetical protein
MLFKGPKTLFNGGLFYVDNEHFYAIKVPNYVTSFQRTN